MNKHQRLQLIKQIHQSDGNPGPTAVSPASGPKPKPLRRRWGMTPMVPLGESSRHRALPNYMFTTLRSRT
ncbi:MAG: hypothetical protein EPN40_09880 [Rhodanobacteraceae bacterium]|nr:MAG: hypothetical protein EPN40_09880 [Rhodanobacteraceae bacterium]